MSDTRRVVWGPRVAVVAFALAGWAIAALHVAFANAPVADFPRDAQPTRPAARPYVCPPEYLGWVIRSCDETGVPCWLLCRLIQRESEWNPNAGKNHIRQNKDGSYDYGLAQLNNRNLEHFILFNDGNLIDPFNPECAIKVCSRILAANYAEFGNWEDSIAAYNVGCYGVRNGFFPINYVRWIMGE